MTDQPTAGRFQGRVHHLPVRVYYEDTDFTGLVYHANYVRYFERGRSDFLRLVAGDHSGLLERERPMAFVVTRMELRFLKAARIDDGLVVETTYDAVRGPRLFISQAIVRAGDRLCEAAVEVACIDLGGRPVRPPADMVQTLKPWLLDQA